MNGQTRSCPHAKAFTNGFTIVELLVSMGVFLMLGVALTVFMNSSVESYTVNSARREAYSNAMSILAQLETDLVHAYLAPGDRNNDIDVRFEASVSPNGSSKVVFVAQSKNPLNRSNDYGLREIAWFVDDPSIVPYKLFRTERYDIGGNETLFTNVQGGSDAVCASFSDAVGYFAVKFFPDTGSLTDESGQLKADDVKNGYKMWDSTRGKLNEFPLYLADSQDYPWDDILPERMQVILTIVPRQGMRAFLMGDIGTGDATLRVNTTEGFPSAGSDLQSFLVVDGEWMQITGLDAESFTVLRGARNSIPIPHKTGGEVRGGYSFMRTIYIPCHGKAIR